MAQNCQRNLKKRNKAGGIIFQTSDNTTKLQSSKECGIDTKRNMWIDGTEWRAQK